MQNTFEDATVNSRTLPSSMPLTFLTANYPNSLADFDPQRPTIHHQPSQTQEQLLQRIGGMRSNDSSSSSSSGTDPYIRAIFGDVVKEPPKFELQIESAATREINSALDRLASQQASQISNSALQNLISPHIYFRYNSVNIIIGRRGSGKTYTTLREILKLFAIDSQYGFGYTQILYVTDKTYDDTVAMFEPLFPKNLVTFKWVPTAEALNEIEQLSQSKSILNSIINNDRIPPPTAIEDMEIGSRLLDDPGVDETTKARVRERLNDIAKKYPADAKESANVQAMTESIRKELNATHLPSGELPHTIIIFDDCIGLFKKDSPLAKKCFENRQMRATIFMLLQDVQGISPSMKSNTDSITLFSGFSKQKWNVLFYQLPPTETDYYDYTHLSSGDALVFDYDAKIERAGDNEFIMRRNGNVEKRVR